MVVLVFVAVMLVLLGVTTTTVLGAQLTGDLRHRLTDRASTAAALVDQVSAQDLVDRLEGDGVSVAGWLHVDQTGYASARRALAGRTAVLPRRSRHSPRQ